MRLGENKSPLLPTISNDKKKEDNVSKEDSAPQTGSDKKNSLAMIGSKIGSFMRSLSRKSFSTKS